MRGGARLWRRTVSRLQTAPAQPLLLFLCAPVTVFVSDTIWYQFGLSAWLPLVIRLCDGSEYQNLLPPPSRPRCWNKYLNKNIIFFPTYYFSSNKLASAISVYLGTCCLRINFDNILVLAPSALHTSPAHRSVQTCRRFCPGFSPGRAQYT